jgi:hypothetical protein
MEAFFSRVKSELGERFESNGDAKMQLFEYIEVFYHQRRRHVGRSDQSSRVRATSRGRVEIVGCGNAATMEITDRFPQALGDLPGPHRQLVRSAIDANGDLEHEA